MRAVKRCSLKLYPRRSKGAWKVRGNIGRRRSRALQGDPVARSSRLRGCPRYSVQRRSPRYDRIALFRQPGLMPATFSVHTRGPLRAGVRPALASHSFGQFRRAGRKQSGIGIESSLDSQREGEHGRGREEAVARDGERGGATSGREKVGPEDHLGTVAEGRRRRGEDREKGRKKKENEKERVKGHGGERDRRSTKMGPVMEMRGPRRTMAFGAGPLNS